MERITIFFLRLLSAFTLNAYVRGGAMGELGPLKISLDCSTNYAIQERSINATWRLNSILPSEYKFDRSYRIVTCNASINCGNGSLTDENHLCNQSQMQYGWRFDHIPLTENFCNISISYDDIKDYDPIYFHNSSVCTFSDDINATAKIQQVTENPIVGNLYEIQCIVHTREVVNSSIVNITWIGPNNGTIMTSRRINITDTTDGNNHTSILQFAYLSEKDKGLHICHVTILNSTVSDFFTIEDLLIPDPIVNVVVFNNKKTIGRELSLGCNVTTVRGVTSDVEIVWLKDDTILKEMSDDRINILNYSTHMSILQFLYLSENDKSEYTCRATMLNTSYSTSTQLNNFDIPTINVSATAVNQNVGDVLSLKCDVNMVKGITSSVYILWTINGINLTIYNGNVTENVTAYTYYYNGTEKLTSNDNNAVYQCQVIISNRLVGNDNVTYTVNVPATPAPVPSDKKSSNTIVIFAISIFIGITSLILVLLCIIGIYVCQTKRQQKMQEVCIGYGDQTNRNNGAQEVCRDHEFRATDDNGFSMIGKDNPSTCESLSVNQKVKEWIKTFQMLEDYESVTNEYMLNYVYGHTTKATQITDSGLDDSEFDSGLSSSKQNTYISHKAAEDMFYVKFDETTQPDTQDVDLSDKHLMIPALDTSELNSECQSPSASVDSYPLLAIQGNQPLLCTNIVTDPTNNGSYVDHCIASNNDDCTLTTTVNGNFIDNQATFNSQPLPCSAEGRSYIDCDAASKNDTKSLSLHSTMEGTLTTTADGNYIDHNTYITSILMQPLFDSNTNETAGEGNYIDRYIASNSDNSEPLHTSATSVSAADGSYIDNDTTFSTDQALSNSNNTA